MTQSTNQQCRLYPINCPYKTRHIYWCRNANAHIFYYNYVLQICLLAFSLNCKFWCPVYFKFAKSRVLFLYWFAFDVSWAPEIVTCIFRTVKLNCNSLNTIFSLTSIITFDHFWYVLLIANIICNQERLSKECFVNIKKKITIQKKQSCTWSISVILLTLLPLNFVKTV